MQNVSFNISLEDFKFHLDYNLTTLLDQFANRAEDFLPSHNGSLNTLDGDTLRDGRDSALAVVEVVVLLLIFVAALVGNIFVLAALWRHSLFRPMSRTYLFMLHLSLADLLVALLNILPQLVWDITYRFHGSDLLCRLVKYAQVFVLYLSTYLLVFMAVDRVRAISWRSYSSWVSLKMARTMVATAWGLSFVLAAPQVLLFAKQEVRPGVEDCWVNFSQLGEQLYVTWFVVTVFLAPLAIIAACYTYICYIVWSCSHRPSFRGCFRGKHLCCTTTHRAGDNGDAPSSVLEMASLQQERNHVVNDERASLYNRHRRLGSAPGSSSWKLTAAKMKTVKMTLTVVSAFTFCWAPFCIAQLFFVYNKPSNASDLHPVFVVFMLLASLNSCINPWIYLYFSGTLLNQLRVALGCGLARNQENASIGDEDPEDKRGRGDNSATPRGRSGRLLPTRSEVV
ncbi:oxytocin receptor-like [Oratosquilla oratoria]|uniref:oxytocin receptor-like n=1 Tax=Oratosquilla oratoria TaxID=337810 RepID=UPI003F77002A